MSKSKLRKAESKLGNLSNKSQAGPGIKKNQKPEGIVTTNQTVKPTSVRLTPDDKANLKQIVQSVNGVSRSKVSGTKVMQALLHMGAQMPPEKVLKAIRELL